MKHTTTNKVIAIIIIIFTAFMYGYETAKPIGDTIALYIGKGLATITGTAIVILAIIAIIWLAMPDNGSNSNIEDTEF